MARPYAVNRKTKLILMSIWIAGIVFVILGVVLIIVGTLADDIEADDDVIVPVGGVFIGVGVVMFITSCAVRVFLEKKSQRDQENAEEDNRMNERKTERSNDVRLSAAAVDIVRAKDFEM